MGAWEGKDFKKTFEIHVIQFWYVSNVFWVKETTFQDFREKEDGAVPS